MKSSRSSSYRTKVSPFLLASPQSSSFAVKFVFAFFFLAIGFAFGIIKGHYIKSSAVSHSSHHPAPLHRVSPPSKKIKPLTEAWVGLKGYKEPTDIMHRMSDEELFWKASMVPRVKRLPYHWFPKIAFLFLTKGEIPLAPLWDKFFEGHRGLFSIYVHSDPQYNGSMPTGSVFYGRRIPSKVCLLTNSLYFLLNFR
jgi:Core-2/I-Branching enzyme